MKKYVMSLLLSVIVLATLAAQKKDTVVLSVYNNNQRFMLYPMPFGKDKPDKHFTAEMVIAFDTVHKLEVSTKRDSSGKFPKRWRTLRQCGKLPKNVKDKVVLLQLNTDCDISTQVLNAQDAGALAVIIIHTTNSTDSVILPKLTGRDRYADENKVKIPCFTVRKVIGEKLTGMLPSLVGIKRPDSVPTIQTMTQLLPTDSSKMLQQGLVKTVENEGQITASDVNNPTNSPSFNRIGWDIAPNPVSNEVTLLYNFQEAHPLSIEVFNELGQLVTNFQLPETQTGKLDINVSTWQSGMYNVRLISGKVKQVKRLVVGH